MRKQAELTSGATVKIAQEMIKGKVEFDAAIGAAILHGDYNKRRKLISCFPNLFDKYK